MFMKNYQAQRFGYRYSLAGINWRDNEETYEVSVIIHGIKKQIVHFFPESIIYDNALLSEFSPSDVRAITYLTFRKYLNREKDSLVITNQSIRKGETVFVIRDLLTSKTESMKAKQLYQDHERLSRMSRADMSNVISTAVQEQIIKDLDNMD